ncbi:MAG: trypsin-like peptidase domain-containing protein, partial [Candidatus Poribacteria bacterium]|nr:trypsin-like peptidase domain-containing protein [Candidatus Poribacteria bacterium]
MKANRKFLFVLPVFLMICACTQVPQQIAFEKPVASRADLSSGQVKDSILLVIATQDNLRRRVGSTSFFVAPNKIATNIHVVAGVDPVLAHVRVKGTTWAIRGVTAYDVKNDLVILEISGKGTPLPLGDSDTVQSGDAVSVMGYPNGKYTVTEGTIDRVRKSDKWFQMDTRISGGNSGSPVINNKGQVIGIAALGGAPFSYAIPSNTLKALLTQSGPPEPLSKWCKRRRIRAFVYANQGISKFYVNHYNEAITNFDKAIELNPDEAETYYNRGFAKVKLADLQTTQGHVEGARA